jgi:hypothetical protein
MTFDDCCEQKHASNDDFMTQWDEADENLTKLTAGEEPSFKEPAGMTLMTRTGYRMKATYSFVTVSDFTKHFRIEPKHLGLRVVKMQAECGTRELSGVLLADTPPKLRCRTVEFFSDQVWFLHEDKCDHRKRLRQHEASDAFKAMNTDKSTNHPAARHEI